MENLKAMQRVVTESTSLLCACLQPEDVLVNLKSQGAILDGDVVTIRSKVTSSAQVECLLQLLQKKEIASYITFMKELETVRKDLHKEVKKLEKKHKFNPDPKGADKPAPYPIIKQSDITVKKYLKSGGFGRVSLAVHNAWGEVAIKEFTPETSADVIRSEAKKMWQVITCPHLAHMIGVIEEGSKQIIVMEYFEKGNLLDFNRKYMMGCDCWARKVKMILEIALGMNFLHTSEPPVIHRDLKLNNIFVGDGWKVKIGDFGLAVNATSIQTKAAADTVGTSSHIPPEIWEEAITKPDELCDVFSFGITLFEFLSGQDPWSSKNVLPKTVVPSQEYLTGQSNTHHTDVTSGTIIGFKLVSGKRPDTEAIPADAPSQIVDIMRNCWDGERNNRPIFQKIKGLVSTIYNESYEMKIHHADSEIMKKFAPGTEKGNTHEGPSQKMTKAGKSGQSHDSGIVSTHQPSHESSGESSVGAKSDTLDCGVELQKQQVGIKEIQGLVSNKKKTHADSELMTNVEPGMETGNTHEGPRQIMTIAGKSGQSLDIEIVSTHQPSHESSVGAELDAQDSDVDLQKQQVGIKEIQGLDSDKKKIHADGELMKNVEPGKEKGNTIEGPGQKMAIAGKSGQSQYSGIVSTHQPSHESSVGAKSDTQDSDVDLQKQQVGIKGVAQHPSVQPSAEQQSPQVQHEVIQQPPIQPAKQQSPQEQHDATHTTHEPGSWVFDSVIKEARMKWPMGIACDGNGGISVVDKDEHNVHFYNEHGVYQRGLDVYKGLDKGQYSRPHGVASTGTTCYLTDRTAYVRVFDSSNGAYKTRWLTVAPGQSVGNKEPELYGINMDGAGNVIVGCDNEPYYKGGSLEGMYISKHRQDGLHIHSFNVSIQPKFLSVTPQDTVTISNGYSSVQVVSQTGDLLHKVQYPVMSGPAGVHCNGNVIYVCDNNIADIFCFSVSGEYIGDISTYTSKYGDGVGKGCHCVCVNEEGNKIYVGRGGYGKNTGRVEVYVPKK